MQVIAAAGLCFCCEIPVLRGADRTPNPPPLLKQAPVEQSHARATAMATRASVVVRVAFPRVRETSNACFWPVRLLLPL
jgi:hypothetical protein